MRIVIAGGGTGGHLFPGLAVAQELRQQGHELLFVGSSRGIEAKAVPAQGFELELLEISGLVRMGLMGTVRGLGRLPRALIQSITILRRFRPNVVMGVGGYASGPLLLAAYLLRIPTAIQEQNSVPGVTNRTLGRLVRAVFGGFEAAGSFFPAARFVVTGNPVRQAFLASVAKVGASANGAGQRVLVLGGSQGAKAVSDLVVEAARLLGLKEAL